MCVGREVVGRGGGVERGGEVWLVVEEVLVVDLCLGWRSGCGVGEGEDVVWLEDRRCWWNGQRRRGGKGEEDAGGVGGGEEMVPGCLAKTGRF